MLMRHYMGDATHEGDNFLVFVVTKMKVTLKQWMSLLGEVTICAENCAFIFQAVNFCLK